MATYTELVDMVLDWMNRDVTVLGTDAEAGYRKVNRFIDFGIDNAYRNLRIAPLEHTVVYSAATAEGNTLTIPGDSIEFIQLRRKRSESENNTELFPYDVYSAKQDIRSFYERDDWLGGDNYIYTRERNDFLVYPNFEEGHVFELYYYRRLPEANARFSVSNANSTGIRVYAEWDPTEDYTVGSYVSFGSSNYEATTAVTGVATFSESVGYTSGDLVVYDGDVYAASSTYGSAWELGSAYTDGTIVLYDSKFYETTDDIAAISDWDANNSGGYSSGDQVVFEDNVYNASGTVAQVATWSPSTNYTASENSPVYVFFNDVVYKIVESITAVPTFSMSNSYTKGQFVVNSGTVYEALVDVASGSVFDSDEWEETDSQNPGVSSEYTASDELDPDVATDDWSVSTDNFTPDTDDDNWKEVMVGNPDSDPLNLWTTSTTRDPGVYSNWSVLSDDDQDNTGTYLYYGNTEANLISHVQSEETMDVFTKDPDLEDQIIHVAAGNTVVPTDDLPEGYYLGKLTGNWLRDENEKVYLFSALVEAFDYLDEPEMSQKYMMKMNQEIDKLNNEDKLRMSKGGSAQVRYSSRLL